MSITIDEPSIVSKAAAGTVLIHAAIWAVVCLFLFFINLVTTLLIPPWFVFPTLGWGLGVVIHTAVAGAIVAVQGDTDAVISTAKRMLPASICAREHEA